MEGTLRWERDQRGRWGYWHNDVFVPLDGVGDVGSGYLSLAVLTSQQSTDVAALVADALGVSRDNVPTYRQTDETLRVPHTTPRAYVAERDGVVSVGVSSYQDLGSLLGNPRLGRLVLPWNPEPFLSRAEYAQETVNGSDVGTVAQQLATEHTNGVQYLAVRGPADATFVLGPGAHDHMYGEGTPRVAAVVTPHRDGTLVTRVNTMFTL